VTIEKNRPWGVHGVLPDDGVLVRSDREARAVVEHHRRDGQRVPPLGLLGGDLCRTVGGRGDEARMRSDEAMLLAVDLGSALLDGRQHWFVSHLVVRRSWWRGRVVAVMNAQWIGRWDVAPKGHPNDGRLDVLDGDLSFDDRLKVRSRLATGTHVPHPGIAQSRVAALQLEFERPQPVWLDGERVARARTLSIRTEPDALTCVV
jgi:hypothetical protein